jgi:adenosylcobinamide-GDP ribazoletransferase
VVRGWPSGPAVNALRLAFGTLSIFPTPPPKVVDKRVAGWAMTLAPLVAACLVAPLWLLTELVDKHWSPYLLASGWVAGLALLTRGMHLDGLADTADGLGSGKPAEAALAIMRKSDIGPFGVATIVLVLLLQVAAAAQLLTTVHGAALLASAVVWSRLVLPVVCVSGVPGAREEGLGSTVAGSVQWPQILASCGLVGLPVAAIAVISGAEIETIMLGTTGVVVGGIFAWWCVRRLGGITGDVLGACVEVTFTAALFAMTF